LLTFDAVKKYILKNFDVTVIGAGAAGLIAAGRAAELGAKVLLIEKMQTAGRKLAITGKGRCNITNIAPINEFIKHVFPNGRFLKNAFANFYNNDIVNLLNSAGVETVNERGGRVFPKSNNAGDIVKALAGRAIKHGVEIKYNSKLKNIIIEDSKVKGITFFNNEKQITVSCKSVILCTGGLSYPATGSTGDGHKIAKSLGHKIENTRPALVPLETEETIDKKIVGLNLRNINAVVWSNNKKISEKFGEMTFTEQGLSGAVILTLSRTVVDELLAKNIVEISIDLKPALNEQKLDARLQRDVNENGKLQLKKLFKQWLPLQLIDFMLNKLQIDGNKPAHQLTGKERRRIRILFKDLRFKISGYRPYKEAIITAGGISTKDINSKTMESKIIENLFFAGELIDLDAETGGYNLQIAFSTGWLAGSSCVNNAG
jgi:predicted Rossmann fold flavoprotein